MLISVFSLKCFLTKSGRTFVCCPWWWWWCSGLMRPKGIIKWKWWASPELQKINILQTATFLSFLTTGEPHVRPCEVLQGLKCIPAYSDCSQLCEMCSSWASQSSRAVWCCCLGACRRGTGRVSVFVVVWAQLESDKQMVWPFSALIFMVATKHYPTPLCCSWAQCWFKGEPFSAPELVLQSVILGHLQSKSHCLS